ncbi:hypothetical protein [Calothrix sp. 336/3]|uniref:hypothetical protein n=1 Tax=Calothrix sp. 336/3 TaxID=1337936 RepID=UPI0004E2E3D6|nr:hypothetical protein [Calothrix sp. 336/3]AKG20120.1 WD repeat-containing protein [Calothrix sp. 336/3]
MISLIDSQNSKISAPSATQRLGRIVRFSQGQFSLVLACCNSVNKQQQLLSLMEEFSPGVIAEIQVPATAQTLYTTMANALGDSKPSALMVRGLESVTAINQLIISTNQMRDEFPKRFQFPVILWVNDDILRKLIWLAPDLKDWAATTIRFEITPEYMVA